MSQRLWLNKFRKTYFFIFKPLKKYPLKTNFMRFFLLLLLVLLMGLISIFFLFKISYVFILVKCGILKLCRKPRVGQTHIITHT